LRKFKRRRKTGRRKERDDIDCQRKMKGKGVGPGGEGSGEGRPPAEFQRGKLKGSSAESADPPDRGDTLGGGKKRGKISRWVH